MFLWATKQEKINEEIHPQKQNKDNLKKILKYSWKIFHYNDIEGYSFAWEVNGEDGDLFVRKQKIHALRKLWNQRENVRIPRQKYIWWNIVTGIMLEAGI